MQPKFTQNSVKSLVKILSKCSHNAAKIRSKFSQISVKIQSVLEVLIDWKVFSLVYTNWSGIFSTKKIRCERMWISFLTMKNFSSERTQSQNHFSLVFWFAAAKESVTKATSIGIRFFLSSPNWTEMRFGIGKKCNVKCNNEQKIGYKLAFFLLCKSLFALWWYNYRVIYNILHFCWLKEFEHFQFQFALLSIRIPPHFHFLNGREIFRHFFSV